MHWFNFSFRDWVLADTSLLNEDFKSQRVKFIGQEIPPEAVDRYLAWFRDIKDKKYKEIFANIPGVTVQSAQRINIDAYPTFHELELVVDYVKGQKDIVSAKFTDVQFSGKPIYSENGIEIYYAPTPRACIQYKGSVPYGWCVARSDASNLFYAYRFKEHEPAFYFVKNLEKTKTEFGLWNATKTAFSGQWRDKFHFFVIQVVKNASPQDENKEQYIVTSAQNDGDKLMSWNNIIRIEPKLNGLQKILAAKPLTDEERQDYKKYKNGISNEEFAKLDYNQKNRYLDIYVRANQPITDEQFASLPEDLKNKYIGFGVGLSNGQYETVKQNNALLKRYKAVLLGTPQHKGKLEEVLDRNAEIAFEASEINILLDSQNSNLIDKYMKKIETMQQHDYRAFQGLIGHMDVEALSKLDPSRQTKIINSIINLEIPVSDPAMLKKIVETTANAQQGLRQWSLPYLSVDMIEKIITFSKGTSQIAMAKEIINLKGDDLTQKDINALFIPEHENSRLSRLSANYADEIAIYIVQNTNAISEQEFDWLLASSTSEKLAHLLLSKYGKNISHELILSILNNVPSKEAAKIALQMKDKLTEEELQHILQYANVDPEELYKLLGHHAQIIKYPDGYNWVVGTKDGGTEPYFLVGPDGKVKVKIMGGNYGVSIHPGGESAQELLQGALKNGGKGKKDWETWQNEILQAYEPPSKWNDYIVDFINQKPQLVPALSLKGGAWSLGTLTQQQREKLFRGNPDLVPPVNMTTSDGHMWVHGAVLGKVENRYTNAREFTLLDNYNPVLILALHSGGNYLQTGFWTSQDPTQAFKEQNPADHSLATAEFILKNNIEHLDTRDKKDYGWKFNDLLPKHQKMVLDRYPDFLEPISFVKKISKDRKEMLNHMRGFRSLELLDDNTVMVEKHDKIGHENLLSSHSFMRLAGSDKWKSTIIKLLDKKIHETYGEDHKYDFEKLAKQGIDPLREKFPFADEEMMNLSREHGYKTSDALSHGIGKVIMPQFTQLLYNQLKKFETEEFKVLLQNEKIYFVTSFDNIVNEYTKQKELNALEERYKKWRENMHINWEEFVQGIDRIERRIDKDAFRDAISGSKYLATYKTNI